MKSSTILDRLESGVENLRCPIIPNIERIRMVKMMIELLLEMVIDYVDTEEKC